MTYTAYPAYKESGVEWLGQIPETWEIRRLRFVCVFQNSNVDKKTYNGQKQVLLCNYINVYRNEFITNDLAFMESTASDSEISSMSLKLGDVIITKDSEDPSDIGVPAIVSENLENVVCGYHLTLIRTNNIVAARFLHRVIQSHPSKAYFYVNAPGITRFGLNQDTIGSLCIPLPSLSEQRAIAAFLDRETARIDTLIAKQEQMITLLREKRQAMIAHAVTKGLDAHAPMKESGVAWLGQVPETWEIRRFKYAVWLNPKKSEISKEASDLLVSFLPMELIGDDGSIVLEEVREIDEVKQQFTYFINDDVILAKITPCFENGKGAICSNLVNGIGFGTTELHVLRPQRITDSHYVYYLTHSDFFRLPGIALMTGAAGQKRVPESYISNFCIPLPPLSEQRAIAAFLDRETARIDTLIAKQQRMIELLKERRSALITAAVTGKIDVRAAGAAREEEEAIHAG